MNTTDFVLLKSQCTVFLVRHMKYFRTYPVVSNSKVEFPYSTIISIIRLFNYYLDYWILPSLNLRIFDYSIIPTLRATPSPRLKPPNTLRGTPSPKHKRKPSPPLRGRPLLQPKLKPSPNYRVAPSHTTRPKPHTLLKRRIPPHSN